ncbi:MAG: methyltransferase domain-containing protein [Alphaproteobacteria bacterium]|nr:methyltransferase domain-containing protein [Alphaproteobacteria bacterium]
MSLDVVDLREFYINPLGRMARRLLRARIKRFWPDVRGETLLAMGYATPLLRPWLEEAGSLIVMMPDEQGVAYWPREGPNMACLTAVADLPLPDESVDRAILMHTLETACEPEAVLREVWRVLKGNGRALIIVPNRRGLWAHSDSTPFGTGQPYSASQLKIALRNQGFLVERMQHALFAPPLQARLALAVADFAERAGGWLFPGCGGLLLMEASKQVYVPILTKSCVARRRLVLPMPFPVSSGPVPAGRS